MSVECWCNVCAVELKLFEDAPEDDESYFTSCGHVMCHECVDECRELGDLCYLCQKRCGFMRISRGMPRKYQFYFEGPTKFVGRVKRLWGFKNWQTDLVIDRLSQVYARIRQESGQKFEIYQDVKMNRQRKAEELDKVRHTFDTIRTEFYRRQKVKQLAEEMRYQDKRRIPVNASQNQQPFETRRRGTQPTNWTPNSGFHSDSPRTSDQT